MNWVLLRGLTRESRHWGNFPQQLAQILTIASSDLPIRTGTTQALVVALDLPGNGVFYQEDSPGSVRSMVNFARRQLLAQGLQPPYSFVAMSLGAMVATDWAQNFPQEVGRLVLINTSMRPFSNPAERLRPGNWLPLALLATLWRNAEYAERVIHRLTCHHPAHDAAKARDADIAAWIRIRKTAPVSPVNAWRQLWAAARFSCAAQPLACATLLLSSAADGLVHPHCSARVAAAWQAVHHQHPWAGHDLPHDDPDWVCQRILQWLD